jgi:hypothetical protein
MLNWLYVKYKNLYRSGILKFKNLRAMERVGVCYFWVPKLNSRFCLVVLDA